MTIDSHPDSDLLEWLANGETGQSSEAMAFAALGVVKRNWGEVPYPRDPADLRRCVQLIEAVPWVRDAAEALLREQSAVWAALLDSWDELMARYEGKGVWKAGTYSLMWSIIQPIAYPPRVRA